MHSINKLLVLPRYFIAVAILIPAISGQFLRSSDDKSPVDLSGAASIADVDSQVDIKVPTKPCCIPSGNITLFDDCVDSTCKSCCSQKKIETTCYQCGKTENLATPQCAAPSLVASTKGCCIPDGFSCDLKSSCGNCCSGIKAVSSQTCLQCA